MVKEARQNVMAILPNCLYDSYSCVRRDLLEHLHAIFLAVDEAMFLLRDNRMSS
jgi:hypothetical protein